MKDKRGLYKGRGDRWKVMPINGHKFAIKWVIQKVRGNS